MFKIKYLKNKKYYSDILVFCIDSRYDLIQKLKKYRNLRKAKILKNVKLEEWTKEEILDLLKMYDDRNFILSLLYGYKNFETIDDYIKNGNFERDSCSLYEKLKKEN